MSNQGLSYAKNMERSAEQAGGGGGTDRDRRFGTEGFWAPVNKIGAQ